MTPQVAAIVLAAGRGTRFGVEPKLLAPFCGKPLVGHAVEAALGSGASPVTVVLGHRGAEIRDALAALPVRFVPNPAYADGLSTSLKAGFAALPGGIDGVLVLLGDMPEVTPTLLDSLMRAWIEGGCPDAAIPTWQARRGNPVLLSTRLAPEIARLEGDGGAGQLLRSHAGVLEVALDTAAVTIDVDTEEALAEAAGQARTSTTPSRIAE